MEWWIRLWLRRDFLTRASAELPASLSGLDRPDKRNCTILQYLNQDGGILLASELKVGKDRGGGCLLACVGAFGERLVGSG